MPFTKYSRRAVLAVLVGIALAAISLAGDAPINEFAITGQPGIGPARESTDTFGGFGSTLYLSAGVALVFVLAIFRGREIRKQHPRSFN